MKVLITHTIPNPEHDKITEQMNEFHSTREKRLAISAAPKNELDIAIKKEYDALEEARDKLVDELETTEEAEVITAIATHTGNIHFVLLTESDNFVSIPMHKCKPIKEKPDPNLGCAGPKTASEIIKGAKK